MLTHLSLAVSFYRRYGGGYSGRSGYWAPNSSDPTNYTPFYPDLPAKGADVNRSGPQRCSSSPPHGQRCNSTLTVPGLKHALALFVQTDNSGPPTLAQLRHYYAEVHRMFPRVKEVRSSTFEDFFAELEKVRHTLPVLTGEIGDTWVDTPPSDPLLAAQFRAVMRARTKCVTEQPQLCNASDHHSAFYNFSRLLLKNVEHDWGYHAGFDTNWTNRELQASLAICPKNMTSDRDGMCQSRMSWIDQRTWGIDFALEALRTDSTHTQQGADTDLHKNKYTPLIQEIERELQELRLTVCDCAATCSYTSSTCSLPL